LDRATIDRGGHVSTETSARNGLPGAEQASREQQAIVAGLTLAALLLPGVARAGLLLVAAGVAAAVRCPRWVSVLLLAAAVPLLLFTAVTGSLWYR
jgi:hypothetical protein